MLPRKDTSQIEKYRQTKIKGMENIFQANRKEREVAVSVLLSKKIDIKINAVVRDKEDHNIIIKGTIQLEDVTLVNLYASNIVTPKYIKQIFMDIKGEINRNAVILRDFNTQLTSMNRSSREQSKQGDSNLR